MQPKNEIALSKAILHSDIVLFALNQDNLQNLLHHHLLNKIVETIPNQY